MKTVPRAHGACRVQSAQDARPTAVDRPPVSGEEANVALTVERAWGVARRLCTEPRGDGRGRRLNGRHRGDCGQARRSGSSGSAHPPRPESGMRRGAEDRFLGAWMDLVFSTDSDNQFHLYELEPSFRGLTGPTSWPGTAWGHPAFPWAAE